MDKLQGDLMARPIGVVFLTQDLCFGGTQRQMLELAARLDRARFTPAIWTLSGPTDLDKAAEEGGIPVRHLGRRTTPGPGFPLVLLRELLRSGPEVLTLCTALPNIWGRLLGWCARVPVVVGSCRGGGAPARQHEALLWRMADHMVCNSSELYNILSGMGMPSHRLTYIANGVDTERFNSGPAPVGERAPLALSVGRLVGDKDHLTLLRAFGMVLERMPDARLRIVGEGPLKSDLLKFIEDQRYGDRVRIVGGGVDVRHHFQEARAFALASLREGQPNVILEAMACALPVAATDVGGVPSLVRHGETGLLSPPGDAAALAENLCRLLEAPARCEAMGLAGRARAESEFSLEVMVRAHERIFERLWNQRAAGAAA